MQRSQVMFLRLPRPLGRIELVPFFSCLHFFGFFGDAILDFGLARLTKGILDDSL